MARSRGTPRLQELWWPPKQERIGEIACGGELAQNRSSINSKKCSKRKEGHEVQEYAVYHMLNGRIFNIMRRTHRHSHGQRQSTDQVHTMYAVE